MSNLYQKLLAVQKATDYLQKDGTSDPRHGAYPYVTSARVLQHIRRAMDEQGLLLMMQIIDGQCFPHSVYDGKHHLTVLKLEFTWVNADNPEERETLRWYGQGIDSGEKGVGKALTYAEKYFLLKFFHVPTGEADDPDAGLTDPHEMSGGSSPGQVPQASGGSIDAHGRPLNWAGVYALLADEGVPDKQQAVALVRRATADLWPDEDPSTRDWQPEDYWAVYNRARTLHQESEAA